MSSNLIKAYVNLICTINEFEESYVKEQMGTNYSAFSKSSKDASCLAFLGRGFPERFSAYLLEKFLMCLGETPKLEVSRNDAPCPCALSIGPNNTIEVSGIGGAVPGVQAKPITISKIVNTGFSNDPIINSTNVWTDSMKIANKFVMDSDEIDQKVVNNIQSQNLKEFDVSQEVTTKDDVLPMILFKFLFNMLTTFSARALIEDFYSHLATMCPVENVRFPNLRTISVQNILDNNILSMCTTKSFTTCESASYFLLRNFPIARYPVADIASNIEGQFREVDLKLKSKFGL